MGRSQRHMLWEQSTTAAGEIHAQGMIAPGIALQVDPELLNVVKAGSPLFNAPPLAKELPEGAEGVVVPVGPPGGPLSGSSLTGAIPEELAPPEPSQTTPHINFIDPDEVVLGGENVTMHVRGSNFTEESVIVFAGNDEPIVFIDETDITTIVTASLPWGAVTVQVQVRNANGEVSNEAPFTFTDAGTRAERNLPAGPFTINRIDDHPDGIAITLADGDVRVGDIVLIEATGNTSINGSFTVLSVTGAAVIIDNEITLETSIDAKGRMTVTGGA
jgi:IPT/TIG domain